MLAHRRPGVRGGRQAVVQAIRAAVARRAGSYARRAVDAAVDQAALAARRSVSILGKRARDYYDAWRRGAPPRRVATHTRARTARVHKSYMGATRRKTRTRLSKKTSFAGRPTSRKRSRSRKPRDCCDEIYRLKRRIKAIDRAANTDIGRLRQRIVTMVTLDLANDTQQNYTNFDINVKSHIDNVLSKLKFFDSATPNTLVSADVSGAAYCQEFMFGRTFVTFELRNSYNQPCVIEYYVYKVKDNIQNGVPEQLFIDGLSQKQSPNSYVSVTTRMEDCNSLIHKFWSPVDKKTFVLQTGQTRTLTLSLPAFKFSPNAADSIGEEYQRLFNSHNVTFGIRGVLGHDSTAGTSISGLLKARVDIMETRHMTVRYSAGGKVDLLDNALSATPMALPSSTVTNRAAVDINRP